MLTKVKLLTNVPLTGFVRQAYYNKGKKGWLDPKDGKTKDLPDSISLKGSWDGSTDESLFLPVAMVGQMLDMGLLKQDAGNATAEPRYTVLQTQKKVRIVKTEEEGNKKRTYISWLDGSAPATATAQQPGPPASTSQPQKPAAHTPARAAAKSEATESDTQKLARVAKAHRKALGTILETQSCAWHGAKVALDELLEQWSLEKTKIPTHVYLDLIGRFAATASIEAFKQNLVVEHKERAAAAPKPGVAAQAAVPLKTVSAEPMALEPVAPPPEPPTPREELDAFPEVLLDDEDDLPF